MRAFIRFFTQRTTLANVFTFTVIFLGLSALTTIQRDNFPSVEFDEMTVTTRYPGASPEDVELNVTNKIEEELKEVDGLDEVISFSMENISIIHIKIDTDARDKDKVKTEVRNAVSRVSELPSEVKEKPLVKEITTSTAIPIIEVGLTGDVPYSELREMARLAEKGLLNVPGVASLTKFGYLNREIKVEVAQDSVERYGISTSEIVAAIQNRNIRATGGSFESYTSEKNIVTLSEFRDPKEVGEVIIKSSADGTVIRVNDLAELKDAFEPEKVLSKINAKPAVSFLVFKKESADIIRTVDAIKMFVDENSQRLPDGINIEYSNDKSRIVRNRIEVVVSNGLMGLALVLIVLSLFLNMRIAFWVAMGIPVALIGTLFLLPSFGAYLDSIALAAMILVIGIIVDDGIVVAENIWHYREQGYSPLDSAVEGTYSVFKPVLTTILTTLIAFSPMFVMTGVMGSFIYVIPLVVTLALIISFFEIILALPAHLYGSQKKINNVSSTKDEKEYFGRFRIHFSAILTRLMRISGLVVGVFLVLLVMAFWYAGKYLDFVLFPTQSADEIFITIEAPSGSSLLLTSELALEVEAVIQSLPKDELDSFVTRIGSHGDFNLGENENWALFGVYLTPFSTRSRNADEIVEALREKINKVQGIEKFRFVVDSGGPPVGRPITMRVVGSDDSFREQLANQITGILQTIEGVKDIDRDDKKGKEEIRIELDYIRLANAGLTVADVARNIRLAYDGELVTSVRYGDEDVDFRVILDEQVRSSPDTLGDLILPNQQGRFVKLGEVASFETQPGPSNIYHFDNERAITITADVDKEIITPLQATQQVMAKIDVEKEFPGMRLIVGGEAEETAESMGNLAIAFIAAAVGIYILLLLLFNSLTQPILVMLAIPFGLIGVIAAFALHGQALGFLAMLGVIGLIGIVVNDSLILVNLVNELKLERPDEPMSTLIVEATERRLRPIILTSITTVAGLLPMAYGLGGSDPFSAPMALAMGYGILFATPLTLVLLPCLLMLQHDLNKLMKSVLSKIKTLNRHRSTNSLI